MKDRQATRKRADRRVELTGARDKYGVLVALDTPDYERLSGEQVREYEARRAAAQADARKQANEVADLEVFAVNFVRAGGARSDAPAAFRAHRKQQAAEAASRAEGAALAASPREIPESSLRVPRYAGNYQ